jgi:hypothetical protein
MFSYTENTGCVQAQRLRRKQTGLVSPEVSKIGAYGRGGFGVTGAPLERDSETGRGGFGVTGAPLVRISDLCLGALEFDDRSLAKEIAIFVAMTPSAVMPIARSFLALLLMVPPGGSDFVLVLPFDL